MPGPCRQALSHRRLFEHADHWFERGRALFGAVPCRLGCTRCCVGPFMVTVLDRLEIQAGLDAVPAATRREIQTRAREQIATIEELFPGRVDPPGDRWTDAEVDELVTRLADVPCPALAADGRCLIYAHRPITCRMTGLPIETGGVIQGACEVQTFVPLIKPSAVLRDQEEALAREEADLIEALQRETGEPEEEVLLPYAFVGEQ
ncbi:YkgJ family cysteine cluster protein [Candidatus Nitrospira bockiana]